MKHWCNKSYTCHTYQLGKLEYNPDLKRLTQDGIPTRFSHVLNEFLIGIEIFKPGKKYENEKAFVLEIEEELKGLGYEE